MVDMDASHITYYDSYFLIYIFDFKISFYTGVPSLGIIRSVFGNNSLVSPLCNNWEYNYLEFSINCINEIGLGWIVGTVITEFRFSNIHVQRFCV